ncbi:MAG TPA: phage holin family protein [Pseudogracilibacillus sp.]|nr:phage holin family protein [Pseudogracilibacillus sp.]
MRRFFLGWISSILLNAIGLLVVAQLFDGFKIEGAGTILLAAVILTILNFAVRPLLIILTIPITILTLGLFILVVNAFILMMTQSLMGDSFIIESFGIAILASILISIITVVLEKIMSEIK